MPGVELGGSASEKCQLQCLTSVRVRKNLMEQGLREKRPPWFESQDASRPQQYQCLGLLQIEADYLLGRSCLRSCRCVVVQHGQDMGPDLEASGQSV
jgi:hypothetical protein